MCRREQSSGESPEHENRQAQHKASKSIGITVSTELPRGLANPRNSHGCMYGTRCHDVSHYVSLCMVGSAAAHMLSAGTILAKNVVSSARR